ncbi:histidine phosphatase family protein [Bifidobacterium sp. ESL0800]|uniref:histidine phosphatase family protein n=1 Tax=Bifidobacterium sp. ESL0800 TaxID=2983236 RepID=UPI0023F65C29|nr:histidine phosphatase family protein [Bifidobacterium sp. ESL0800]WEV76212.1 histidine phosphatase family protein [Bifidobacterium sp. ESL0800]
MIDEVILLRHGRTAYNVVHRLQGQIDVPLDIIGQWQVDQTGLELAKRYYWAKVSNIAANPDLLPQPGPQAAEQSDTGEYQKVPAGERKMKVISSDLFRAAQTAHAFADILGLPVTLDKRLRERSFGQWEGKTRPEIKEMDAEAYRSWRAHEGGETKYGVETRTEVGARGAKAVLELLNENAQDTAATTLMLVSHGSFIAATVETLLGMDPEVDELGNIPNAYWSTLKPRIQPDGSCKWTLAEFNCGPVISTIADWSNGPEELRYPGMELMKPLPVTDTV